jgi:hypothetical protein
MGISLLGVLLLLICKLCTICQRVYVLFFDPIKLPVEAYFWCLFMVLKITSKFYEANLSTGLCVSLSLLHDANVSLVSFPGKIGIGISAPRFVVCILWSFTRWLIREYWVDISMQLNDLKYYSVSTTFASYLYFLCVFLNEEPWQVNLRKGKGKATPEGRKKKQQARNGGGVGGRWAWIGVEPCVQ